MSAGPPRLLGREAEVAELVRVLTGDDGGHVAAVGSAGIGKSTLLREVASRAEAAGILVRSTVGATSERGLPFVGLHDLVGHDAEHLRLPEPLRAALDVTVLHTRAAEVSVDPTALNLAVLRVLEQLSAERRLLLVLDDLPWVDVATRASLAFVLRRLAPDRISTLAALRPEAMETLGGTEADIVPPGLVRTVAIGPLDEVTLAAVVEGRLGSRLSHRLSRQLHEASAGNPLLALELARSATLGQGLVPELTVPERYRAVLGPRLDALSPDARRSLLAAALLARPSLEVLGQVVPVDGVLEAESAGVVRIEAGLVRFAHPLFAALCRDSTDGGERRDLHALLAKVAPDEIERARHLGAATILPDESVAAGIEAAAHLARSRAAIAAAADLMTVAERLTPAAEPELRTRRGCAAAELFFELADLETAARIVRRLLEDLEPGRLRARCLMTLGQVTAEDSAGAATLYEEALRQPGLDPDTEHEARFCVARILGNLGDLSGSRSRTVALEADTAAAGRDDLARLCRAHIAWIDLMTGRAPARSPVWQRMVAEADAYEPGYDHPDLLRSWEAMAREDNARALALIDRLMDRVQRAGDIRTWAALAQHRGDAQLRLGNIESACALLQQASRISADGRHDEALLYFRAIAAAWQGRLDDARTDAEAALAMARRVGNRLFEAPAHHALGFVELSDGREEAAAQQYDAVVAGMRAMGWRHPGLVVWHGNAVEAFLAVGRRTDAAALVDELEAAAVAQDLTTSAALARRCRGLICADAGDLDAAITALDESVRLSAGLENPLEHARTLLARGVVHRRRRQKGRSRDDIEQAAALLSRHGAVVWAARAERELARSTAAAAGAELTSAERAVAELAAGGASNRDIAGALYVSEKTVEAALTRVYRKLAVRSRSQLARHPDLGGDVGPAGSLAGSTSPAAPAPRGR